MFSSSSSRPTTEISREFVMGNNKPTVDVIVVNFNSASLLATTIASIQEAEGARSLVSKVVVVDNASTDGSANQVNAVPLPVTVIRNGVNVGFAAACNQGAAKCWSEYLLFLNPDVELLPETLRVAVAAMENPAHSATGIIGVQLLDKNGKVWRSCARFPTPRHMLLRSIGIDRIWPSFVPPHFMTEWDHSDSRTVDQIPGAFFLVRRSLFEQLGGFDAGFFVYYEDLDFALRAKRLGANTAYLADARAYHAGQGTTRGIVEQRLAYVLTSKVRYSFKHFGVAWGCAILIATLFLEPLTRVGWAALCGRWMEVRATVLGVPRFWKSLLGLAGEEFKLTRQ